jgi:Peptidase family M28
MKIRRVVAAVLLCLCAALLPAQVHPTPGPTAAHDGSAEVVTDAHIQEIVSFLASDELMGRDTPSPGQDKAAEYIANHFATAGLEQAAKDSWFHVYSRPGQRFDATAVSVKVVRKEGSATETKDLQPGEEVRLYRPGAVTSEDSQQATVALAADPRVGRLLRVPAGQRPVLVEAGEPFWSACAGNVSHLDSRRQGGCPVFLVKPGALPAGAPGSNPENAQYVVTFRSPAPDVVDIKLRNVVGVLRGSEKPDEYVMVSAHYDHLGIGPPVGGDPIYNGADDDASGTTAVVLLAESLAQGPRPRRNVMFVCFSGEEKGLLGSEAFAAKPPVPLAKIVVDVNLEMIGRPMPGKRKQAWITGPGYSDFATIAKPAFQRAGVELVDFDMQDMLFAQSDNYSLAEHGVVAHSISAGYLHPDYHRPSDEVAKLDIPHMTAVIRGLREVVLDCANRAAAPAWTQAGKKVVERGHR